MQRRLTTILAMDVAGYSRLVGVDEEGVIAALRAHRSALVDPLIARHGGRLANTAGDSILVDFPSAVEAVRCAQAIQAGMRGRNSDIAADARIVFRIGVNLGDVLVTEDGDMLGDGVNIAARLEQLSAPGGVVISRSARDAVRDRMALSLADLGEVSVKNIARPVRAFRVAAEGDPPPPVERPRARGKVVALAAVALVVGVGGFRILQPHGLSIAALWPGVPVATAGPSIVVLPFAEAGDGAREGLLGAGLAQDIAGALSRFGDLTVIASESAAALADGSRPLTRIAAELGARNILTGTVARDGDRVRIAARLQDAETGRQLWAEDYDVDGGDIFDVRDRVARAIASTLGEAIGVLASAKLAESKRRDTEDLEAYELVLLAAEARHRFDAADNARALALLERAIALDPQYARAHADLAWTHWQSVLNGFADDPGAAVRSAIESADAAIRADPHFSDGYWVKASVTMCDNDDPARAVALFEKALELNPNHLSLLVEWGGYILPQTLDRADEGVALVERAKRLNPLHPSWYDGAYVSALLFARRPEDAIRAYAAVEYPQTFLHALLAAAYAHTGRIEEAQGEIARVRETWPELTLSSLDESAELCGKAMSDSAMRYLREGLKLAGLPA
jgi:adenylate cyclase